MQPPSGGCVLKLSVNRLNLRVCLQPPSGGCVLKLIRFWSIPNKIPAAFGRLCVETFPRLRLYLIPSAAAFGRLCVETVKASHARHQLHQPPSGGCVLKQEYI